MECVTPPVLLVGFLSTGDSESVVLIDWISPNNNSKNNNIHYIYLPCLYVDCVSVLVTIIGDKGDVSVSE